jgi:phosphatidate cytidylyltransferase
MYEYFTLLASIELSQWSWISFVAALGLPIMADFGGWFGLQLMLFVALMMLTIDILYFSQNTLYFFPMLLYRSFGVFFIAWELSHLVLLRRLPEGQWYVLFLCLTIWVGDSVAMYVGRSVGRHKMAPAVSPGKTWEGAVGGVIGGVMTSVFSASVLLPHLALWQRSVLGVLIALTSQLSDLGESMLKRHIGVKDSSRLIPGHGGVLDRVDSLLFATPAFVYALKILGVTVFP